MTAKGISGSIVDWWIGVVELIGNSVGDSWVAAVSVAANSGYGVGGTIHPYYVNII